MPLQQADHTTTSTDMNIKPPGGDEQEAGQPNGLVKQEIWWIFGHQRGLQRLTADSDRAAVVHGSEHSVRTPVVNMLFYRATDSVNTLAYHCH